MLKLSQLFKKHPIQAVYLFGSRATEKPRPTSDYDFGILLNEKVSPAKYLDLKLRLTVDIVHELKNNRVDVVLLNEAPLLLKYEILRHGKCLYNTNPARTALYVFRILSLYFDWSSIQKRLSESLIKRIAREGLNA